MRHLIEGRKLNRTPAHRRAMLSNMVVSLFDKERIVTTLPKAKELRRVAERLITYGKKGTLHAIRLAARRIKNKTILKKLFDDIAPSYKDRVGGYTRIIKLGERKSDNAQLAIIELTGRSSNEPVKKKAKKKGAKTKKTTTTTPTTSTLEKEETTQAQTNVREEKKVEEDKKEE